MCTLRPDKEPTDEAKGHTSILKNSIQCTTLAFTRQLRWMFGVNIQCGSHLKAKVTHWTPVAKIYW